MSTFYFDPHAHDDIKSQWIRHIQTRSYIADIGEIVAQNRMELQESLRNASIERKAAINQVCGTLDNGFREVSERLQTINFNISELRGEINEMAAMLDWKLSQMIEEQRLTNELLGHIAKLLRIPDSQKQRTYHIEQGLKYLKNAMLEGLDSSFYSDALEGFRAAEQIERKDFITLNRIGQIHLYARQYMDIALAEQYFLRSARESLAESNMGGMSTAKELIVPSNLAGVYDKDPFKAATAESYLYAARACYLQRKLPEAIAHATAAYRLVPEFVEAGFEQAKFLASNGQSRDAVLVLKSVLSRDRYFALKVLSDPDLSDDKDVLAFITSMHLEAIGRAKDVYNRCLHILRGSSKAKDIIEQAGRCLSDNTLFSALKAGDLLGAMYQFEFSTYSRFPGGIRRQRHSTPLTIEEFIGKENDGERELARIKDEVKSSIVAWSAIGWAFGGAAIGFVVGFFKGCTPAGGSAPMGVDGDVMFGTLITFSVIAAFVGGLVGSMSEPSVHD